MSDYRICYDSTDPNAIPSTARLVLQYLDGANRPVVDAWRAAAAGRFANARKVGIVVLASTNDGLILDVERGDATPQQAPGWVQMRRAAGVDPTVYCSFNDWPTVRQCFLDAKVAEPHYFIAAYDNHPAIPPGAIAKQYANAPLTGGNFDISSVADYWPGVDEGDTMTEADFRAVILAAVHGTGQADKVNQQQVNNWAYEYSHNQAAPDAIIALIVNTPDAVAYKAAVAKLLSSPPPAASLPKGTQLTVTVD